MQAILDKITQKAGVDLVQLLADQLTGSELNSLLLEVFQRKTAQMKPADLLRQYSTNRFVQPAEADVLQLRSQELHALHVLKELAFAPIALSPVSLLGTSAVLGTVNQKKIISATRGTEVLSDATNAMAIHIASQQKQHPDQQTVKYCTTHRHVRTPPVEIKGYSPHFAIACCVSAGMDTGSYAFEINAVIDHFHAIQRVLREVFGVAVSYFKLQPRTGYPQQEHLLSAITEATRAQFPVTIDKDASPNAYYQGIQYKAIIDHQGMEIAIADGGFVNWTQQLLENKKARYFISGLGTEYLSKLQ
ncbi:hypothetical protein [Chitinophaga pinensis]|uniref:Uncharacterized protein n=1 Tax=Chitinophaga pinensis TaxID=79329 RepID=A0A5C6LNZ2_9BACT|nr:hypothetical protein [Chitinophaga pinensis]TWV96226.1 hypothetical protein FEF09_23895 [Chitinophaga pinensis]